MTQTEVNTLDVLTVFCVNWAPVKLVPNFLHRTGQMWGSLEMRQASCGQNLFTTSGIYIPLVGYRSFFCCRLRQSIY